MIVPKWYSFKPHHSHKDGLFVDCKKIIINHNNIKPPHINQDVQNTEFWIKRKRKECTVVLGESWTYGESLMNLVSSNQHKFDLETQINHCWGTTTATLLDTDYYQYAVPGNNNATIFGAVERILQTVCPLYDTVYLLIQMTEPAREEIIVNDLQEQKHPLAKLYDQDYVKGMTVKEWCVQNEDILFTQLETTLSKFKNVKTTAWKNFCTLQNKNDYNFKILEETWIEFSARVNGHKVNSPDFYVAGWLQNFLKIFPGIEHTMEYFNKQLDLIEASNKFLKECHDHIPHPGSGAHKLWGYNVFQLMDK